MGSGDKYLNLILRRKMGMYSEGLLSCPYGELWTFLHEWMFDVGIYGSLVV
jgi:hypothetical protein